MKIVKIRKTTSPFTGVNVKYCDTFLTKFLGLMFSKRIDQDYGLFFVEKDESRINTTIHMMFMNYDITVLWLNRQMVIVDKVLAKKWFPIYIPKEPAQYVVELHPSRFSEYSIGEKLIFDKTG